MEMSKNQAVKKIQIAIDKIIDLEEYKQLDKIAYKRNKALEILRELEGYIYN